MAVRSAGLAIGGRHFRSVDNLGVSHRLSGEVVGQAWLWPALGLLIDLVLHC
jgi:hypothetical protein